MERGKNINSPLVLNFTNNEYKTLQRLFRAGILLPSRRYAEVPV